MHCFIDFETSYTSLYKRDCLFYLAKTHHMCVSYDVDFLSSLFFSSYFFCIFYFFSFFSLSHRLGRRKILFEKRKKISDYALVMGMFGIIIMVIENELSSAGVYNKEDVMSTGLKTLISISTVVLLVLIVAYHMLEIQVRIYKFDAG